ncbi:MAG: AEC family transporter, partial [Chitinophagales bacterium]|nr:AEC family transporter [Chitinophagales bacterium]
MHPFLLIPIYIFTGYFLKKTGIGKESLALWLNRIVINACLPSLALLKVPRLQASSALLLPASVAWVVFFVAFLFVLVLSWRLCLDNSTKGSFLLCCGLFNSAFIGFPMVQALYGDHALSVAIITDQLGSFLVLSTAGLFAAAYYSGSHISYKSFFARIFSFAPFWAFLIALFLKFSDLEIPNMFNP